MSRETEDETPAPAFDTARPADRYGTTEKSRRTNRLFGVIGGVGVAVVLVVWVWWAGLAQPGAKFETRDLGWSLVDERTISVRFEVSVSPGTDMSCALQALNGQYGIVGWVVVDIPPSDTRTRVFNQAIRTSETPVTGLLYRCWVP